MHETVKFTLFISILINLLFLGLTSIFIVRKGGKNYIFSKISWLFNDELKTAAMYDVPFYRDKITHFDTLHNSESGIIFLGDSLTDLCEWAEVFQNARIKNRGICGDTTDGVLKRLDNIIESRPQELFIMIGINDLNQGEKIANIVNNYRLILEHFKHQIPETKVFVQSLLPISTKFRRNKINNEIIELNGHIKELAKDLSFQYIDLFSAFLDKKNELDEQYTSDGLHLNGKGYLVWKEIIEKYVVD
jgi:lysophospholipase L1-like esterase